ncbi:MAG: hypothetical protein NWQ46_06975 [Spirosomaceae bacterium]|nr:hypothetical protein [Spirosomataceae bacterium]
MKTCLLFLFILLNSTFKVNAQGGSFAIKSAAEKVDKVLDRKTGSILSEKQLQELFSKHPNIVLDYEITKYGTKENLSYHSDSIRTGAFNRLSKYPALKVGEQVHKFVFETLNGEKFASEDLKGKYVIIAFDLMPKGRFVNTKILTDLDNQIELLDTKENVAAFACFMERDKSQFDELQLTNLHIVPGSSLFLERFGMSSTPKIIVFDTAGNLITTYGISDKIDLKSIIE